MSRNRVRTRPPDRWSLKDLQPQANAPSADCAALILKNDRPLGRVYLDGRRFACDLTNAQMRDLDLYAEQFMYVFSNEVFTFTGMGLMSEGVHRIHMHKMLTTVTFGRRDGDITDVHDYDHQNVSSLQGRTTHDPAVRTYLLTRGENEIFTPSGTWERLDRPDWGSMNDTQIERIGYGLITWATKNGTLTLGWPNTETT